MKHATPRNPNQRVCAPTSRVLSIQGSRVCREPIFSSAAEKIT